MRSLRQLAARFGQPGAQAPANRWSFGSLSLGSTADRRVAAGVDARRPTAALELRRAAEVQHCADKGWRSALICLGNMRKGGVSPGSAAYNVALKACAGAGEWDRAKALLADMEGAGATPDAVVAGDIIRAAAEAGAGSGAVDSVEEGAKFGGLSCDSGPTAAASAAAAAAASGASSGNNGGASAARSMSSISSVVGRGGGAGGGSGGVGATGVDKDGDGDGDNWPGQRPAHDYWMSSSSSSSSSSGKRKNAGGGGGGSTASMHTVAVGTDAAWPSRRATNDDNGTNSTTTDNRIGGGDGGRRSPGSMRVKWGGRSWREKMHQDESGSHAWSSSHRSGPWSGTTGTAGNKGGDEEWARPSPQAAPFAGGWGDD